VGILKVKNSVILFSLIATFPTLANAGHDRSAEYAECIDHTNGIAMNSQYASCAEDEYKRQEKVLNESFSKLMSSSSKENQALLEKGQKAWVNYRENWCQVEIESSEAPGGYANYYYCLLQQTNDQIDVINRFEFETYHDDK
jgi:uncharacterized protein YecT (DUF1311 family)